ncbi:Hypothetical protein NTJ_08708 [Nesidiocoris tenuis]|uniref:Secreted protein n=1 Tax=Nesidiocoris tenuis TaxID=355587 RepID=A0ABN7AWK5_9HEMI|nr:Hypothetical protein NTJ_08708 [Nesidiocoris tenuis]
MAARVLLVCVAFTVGLIAGKPIGKSVPKFGRPRNSTARPLSLALLPPPHLLSFANRKLPKQGCGLSPLAFKTCSHSEQAESFPFSGFRHPARFPIRIGRNVRRGLFSIRRRRPLIYRLDGSWGGAAPRSRAAFVYVAPGTDIRRGGTTLVFPPRPFTLTLFPYYRYFSSYVHFCSHVLLDSPHVSSPQPRSSLGIPRYSHY